MDSDARDDKSFKERESDLLAELSALYTKLNQVRDKRAKAEQESTTDGANDNLGSDADGTRRRRPRVVLVTRTLPFTLINDEDKSQWRAEFPENVSLDAAIETYLCLHETHDCVWIGSVHGEVEPSEQNTLKDQLLQDRNYYPVFLDPKREKLFYQGFCKTVMWPLFHSIPPTTEDQLTQQDMDLDYCNSEDWNVEKMWQAYVAVNQAFADAVQEVYEEGDLIWIQGYHLTLVPQMVQSLFPNDNIHIGYFMHIPFPTSEFFRILNTRDEILTGMLGADLIGFQTYEYARHFQSSAVRLLGLESSHKGVDFNGHFARVTICPVGIDADKFVTLARSEAVNEQIRQLKAQFAGKKVMLGVDQLDPTKGIVHKLLAVDELFTMKPELAQEVVFVQIVTGAANQFDSPLGAQVESLVSRINSKLQDIGADAPVQYLNQEIAVETLIALYALADTLVVTPVRDGMNTIPFEYVVCREAVGRHARVVLSEFAGCAHSLGGAMLVNPWNTEELQDALMSSLQDTEEVMRGHQTMYSYVSTFTSRHWADNFLEQLEECSDENALAVSGRELSRRDMTSAYLRSSKRLLFINYEGVLAAEASIPELSYPPQELLWQLSMLTKDPRNTVVIVSARSTAVCEQWFAGLSGRIVLAAEYGVYVKWMGEHEAWRCMVPNMDTSWWEHVVPLLEYYTERTPGAFIERKDSSVAWHYRDCDLDHGLWQASELLISLREITRSLPVAVVPGNRYLEVRPQKVSKASLFERIWEFMNYSTLFPEEDPVDTDYFGDMVQPLSSPLIKPRTPTLDLKERWRKSSQEKSDDLSRFRLDDPAEGGSHSGGEEPQLKEENDQNEGHFVDVDTMDDNMTTADLDDDSKVDFVLVIASGDDRTDEDLFTVLVPPPIDLEAYCRQLEKDQMLGQRLSESTLLLHDEDEYAAKSTRRRSWMSSGAGGEEGSHATVGSLDDSSASMIERLSPRGSFRRLLHRESSASNGMILSSSGQAMDESELTEFLSPPLARLASHGAEADILLLGENITKLTPLYSHSSMTKPTISEDAATMFPRALLTQPTTARRDEITEKSKFTPRRDFPPSAALFKAMKTKYGENFGMHRVPDTPAACWALVIPPTARAKLEDQLSGYTMDRKGSTGASTIKQLDGDDALELGDLVDTSVAEGDEEDLMRLEEALERARSNSRLSDSRRELEDEMSDDGRYIFPVNTFVCTLGRKLSQAPYYIKNSADLFQLLQEMGLSSHLRRQRQLSMSAAGGGYDHEAGSPVEDDYEEEEEEFYEEGDVEEDEYEDEM